ncbi:MAG: chorismate synthase [Nonlabens sp.]
MRILTCLFCAFLLILSSCSSDDSNGSNDIYFPLEVGNEWEYSVTTDGNTFIDVLRVASVTGETYQMEVEPALPAAIMSSVLSNATLQQDGGRLIGTGSLTFDLFGLDNLDFTVTDAALYDQNESQGTTLTSVDGSLTRPIQGFDLVIDYTATTVQQESLENLSVGGVVYSNIIHSQLIINVEIGTTASFGGFDIPVVIMPAQDVFVIDNYWAQDVGLVRSTNNFSYTLSDFSSFGVALPFPQTADILTVQELDEFRDTE